MKPVNDVNNVNKTNILTGTENCIPTIINFTKLLFVN